MRRRLSSLALAGILGIIGVLCVGSASSAALPPQWSAAIEVPGTATLNVGGYDGAYADVEAVSCATPGNCAAGGYYTNQWRGQEAFVVDETNGTWGDAIEVPGLATGNTEVISISCATAGNCVAGGYSGWAGIPFVVSEVDGTWGAPQELPGMSSLSHDGAAVTSLSCASAGNCAAGGTYMPNSGTWEAFVVNETNGTWGTAIRVPGMSTLNAGHSARLSAVSCGAAGNCAAVGGYSDADGYGHAFVVDETNGTWGTAIAVPGMAALQDGGSSWLESVSCPTAGNCVAGGSYGHPTEDAGTTDPFVVAETNGTWGTAIEVPGAGSLNKGLAHVQSVSCGSAGNCAAGGVYTDGSGTTQVFVVDETSGSWGTAIELPGTAGLNKGRRDDRLKAISCGAAGTCVAAGYYGNDVDDGGSDHAFVASEANGVWAKAIELPGTAALNSGGGASVQSVSCASPHDCAVGGQYVDASGNSQAFVATSTQLDGATTLEPADAGGVYGGTTNLTATLTSGGTGVAGATVSFTLNGASVGSATTDVDGVATLQNVSLQGNDEGSYPNGVGASFDADGNPGSASSGSSSLTVYPAGLVGANGVSVNTSGAMIDSFDSSRGAYSATGNHGSNALVMSNGTPGLAGVSVRGGATSTQGAVTVASTAHVSGNITAGTTASIQGTVGGTVTENSPSTAFSQPTVAACSPFSPKKGISGGTFSYSASTGNLTVKMGTVKLANGTYCFHTIALTAGTKLAVSGPVTINLTGKITGASGHIVNSTNNPANLHINASYGGTGGLTLQGSSHAYMTILAPATSVTITNGSFFGTLFAGTVRLTGSATVHADTPSS